MRAICYLAVLSIIGQTCQSSDDTTVVQVDYSPPRDTVHCSPVRIVGASDIQFVKLHDPLEVKKETTLAIPLRNEGAEDRVITRIVLSCGCMSAILKEKLIASGGTTTLYVPVVLDSAGSARKRVGLMTDDGSETAFFIDAQVKQHFDITPSHVFFDENTKALPRVKITSNFGDLHFVPRLLDAEMKLVPVDDANFEPGCREFELQSSFANSQNRNSKWTVPIRVETPEKAFEYSLVCHDTNGIQTMPEKLVAMRQPNNIWACKFVITKERLDNTNFSFQMPVHSQGVILDRFEGKWFRDYVWTGTIYFKSQSAEKPSTALIHIFEDGDKRKLGEREVQFVERLESLRASDSRSEATISE